MVDTVILEEETSDNLTISFPSSLYDDQKLSIEVRGLDVERSYEDRNVFVEMKTTSTKETDRTRNLNSCFWMKAEKAIELGLMLIKHGNFTMKANMVNHQLIHHQTTLSQFIEEGRVKKIQLVCLSEDVPNHDDGFALFQVTPKWKKKKAPKFLEDFTFQEIINFPHTKREFEITVKNKFSSVPVEFILFDQKSRQEKFKKMLNSFKLNEETPTKS